MQHNADYVSAAEQGGFLYNKPHIFHAAAVLRAGGNYINPRRVNAAVPQNIRKLCDVLFYTVKCPCK